MSVGADLAAYRTLIAQRAPGLVKAPPVTESALDRTAQLLRQPIPEELAELLRVENGGFLFDSFQWASCSDGDDSVLFQLTHYLRTDLRAIWKDDPTLVDRIPGQECLYVATAGQVGVLYDPSCSAKVQLLDVISRPAIVPLAPSLSDLVACYLALLEAGLISVAELPYVSATEAEVRSVLSAHRVSAALFYSPA